jgi:putative acetyltransferase
MDKVVRLREERGEDCAAIHEVNRRAFPTSAEADLVDALRGAARPWISLVAEIEDQIVGHILFTPVRVVGEAGERPALGLAPMAVLPAFQNRGIGSRLVRAGLEACRAQGHSVVFVLGPPDYSPRFGFQPAAPRGLHYKGPEFDPYFMVAEVEPGALDGWAGRVEYRPEFDGV